MQKKVDSGELFTERHNDILTQAIGNPEHGGRVRGVGGNVTLKEYFGKAKRRLPIGVMTVEEVAMLTKKLTAQVKAETMAEMETQLEQKTINILKAWGIRPPPDEEVEFANPSPILVPSSCQSVNPSVMVDIIEVK